MKVLKTIAAVALLLAARQASALVDVSAFGGFTTFNMKSVNETLDAGATQLSNAYGLALSDNSRITGGYYAGVDALFSVIPGLKVGPRAELLMANGALLKVDFTDEVRLDTSMILGEVGASTELPLGVDNLSLQLGVWLGYGLAYGGIGLSQAGIVPNVDNISGQDVLGELDLKLQYKITHLISVGLDLGYRVANIRHMFYSADDTVTGVKSGDVLRDTYNRDLAFDFGGKNLGVDISFNF